MIRIEPNLLLAVATGLPLLLLTLNATVFDGAGGPDWRYPFLAGLYTVLYVALYRPLSKLMRLPLDRPPMISPDTPSSILWAGIFPAILMVMAIVPMVLRGWDYGLLIVIGSVLFGITVQSAMKANRPV